MNGRVQLFNVASLLLILNAKAQNIDCKKNCKTPPDYTDPNYKPQECAQYCKNVISDESEMDYSVESDVKAIKILLISQLVLGMLSLAFLLLLFMKTFNVRKFVAKLKKRRQKEADQEKGNMKVRVTPKGKCIPDCKTSNEQNGEGPMRTSSVRDNNHISSAEEITKPRKRMPSESTCPDTSRTVTGFDNLGLSTSTLNCHSRPSSPYSQEPPSPFSERGGLSMATLNTTVHLDSSLDSPERNGPSTPH